MKMFYLFVFLFSGQTLALVIEFIGPCSSEPLLRQRVELRGPSLLGDLTIQVLDHHKVPYKGSAAGINQMFNAPTGLEAMEVLSDHEMLAYGWCYEVDGEVPEVYPDKFELSAQMRVIRWFYGYGRYLKGDWTEQCLKAHLRKPDFICSPSSVKD